MPQDVCGAASATAANLPRPPLSSDGIFRAGSASQLAAVTGSVSAGYTAGLAR